MQPGFQALFSLLRLGFPLNIVVFVAYNLLIILKTTTIIILVVIIINNNYYYWYNNNNNNNNFYIHYCYNIYTTIINTF